jgi:hypothetical protein
MGMRGNDLASNGVEILLACDWHTPAQINQGVRHRLEDHVIAAPGEDDVIALL